MIELDAHEFGLHLKEGGWRLGLLVARSVEPGEGMSERGSRRRVRDGEGKISASRFAEQAGTTNDRVMRYYRAWERFAAKGKVPHADTLIPGLEPDLDWQHLPRWQLSEVPADPGATGPLNLTVKLGQFGQRLVKSHKRFITFVQKDLPKGNAPGKSTKELAGKYAACLETEARLLRAIEAGENLPDADELSEELNPSKFFQTI